MRARRDASGAAQAPQEEERPRRRPRRRSDAVSGRPAQGMPAPSNLNSVPYTVGRYQIGRGPARHFRAAIADPAGETDVSDAVVRPDLRRRPHNFNFI